eukprot:scaffold10626_cov112-Cylindrotheca_fusiformis.AAC.1
MKEYLGGGWRIRWAFGTQYWAQKILRTFVSPFCCCSPYHERTKKSQGTHTAGSTTTKNGTGIPPKTALNRKLTDHNFAESLTHSLTQSLLNHSLHSPPSAIYLII